MPGQSDLPGPLEGIRVLDLSRVVSGPLCGRMLADLGADVVKIEPPEGDNTRKVPPFVDERSAYFAQMNAGKRSVCLDLKRDGAVEVVARLAERSDVLIENFRPGVLDRLGLGADALLARNPRLVYCSVTGWGQDGPWRDRRAYAPLVHAEVGTLEFAARMRGRPAEQEVHVHGDVYPALMATNAITAALYQRSVTGKGQHLDVAMGQVMPYVSEWTAVELQHHDGDRGGFDIWTHHVFHTADGVGVALVGNPTRLLPAWLKALRGDESVLEDERFATEEARNEHRDATLAVLADLVRTFPDFAAIEAAVEGWPMMVAEVRSITELAATPWAAHRRLVADALPGLPVPAAAWQSDGATIGVAGPPPRLGEHTHEVLRELGCTDADIADLVP